MKIPSQQSFRFSRLLSYSLTVIVTSLTMVTLNAFGDSPKVLNSLNADFSIGFMCGPDLAPEIVRRKFLSFFADVGFQTMDLNRVRQFALLEVEIAGLDANGRLANLDAIPTPRGRYGVSFFSRPPTQRNVELENRFLAFVSDVLKCKVVQVLRNSNDVSATPQYESAVTNFKNSYREAKRE